MFIEIYIFSIEDIIKGKTFTDFLSLIWFFTE